MRSGPVLFLRCAFSATLLLGIAACEPNSEGFIGPEGLNTITVLVRENTAYPIYQFRCGEAEGPGESDDCPEGFECDALHYHGVALSIGVIAPTGAADVRFNQLVANDPDSCHCGWGKVGEADVRSLTVFKTDIVAFFSPATVQSPATDELTDAEAMSVDPCGG